MDRSGTHRTEEIQQEIDQLSSRDWQLWSIGILLMLVFASGFLAPGATESGVVAAQLDSRSSFCSAIDVWLDHVGSARQHLSGLATQIAELNSRVAHTRAGVQPTP